MAGQIIKMITSIVEQRSKGNKVIADLTMAKICMKGVNSDKFNSSSPDDPVVIEKLKEIAKSLNINI